jgi:5,10-methylenetetrahydromethanopterin reductase
MAKSLRIGSAIDSDRSFSDSVAQLAKLADAGFDHAFATQTFDHDALTLLAAAGTQVPGIGLGTCVVPVYRSHPMALAQQALTVQSVTGNRLILGIGLSHQVVVEGMWGIDFDKPARYMKEYLAALIPLLHGETVNVSGDRVTANAFAPIGVPGVEPPPVLVAALGPTMLKLAGRVADGTITWMTGTRTIESHISPTIRAAADAAGRPEPRIAVALPVSVTADVDSVKARVDKLFAIYPNLPSYKAMLDLEGAQGASDIGFLGDERSVVASITRLHEAGATDFLASVVGSHEERERTFALLSELAHSD